MGQGGFTAIATTIGPYTKEIISICVPLSIWFLNRRFQPSARLIHSIRHTFRFLIPEPLRDPEGKIIRPTQSANVTSLAVTNVGRTPAKNVELVFNWKPAFVNVWPLRHYTTLDSPDGRHSIVLESLAPKEVFGMELLAINQELPGLCNVRSEQTESVQKQMIPQIVQPVWFIGVLGWLLAAGCVATVYIILLLIEVALRG
jgi:hypothetical protein